MRITQHEARPGHIGDEHLAAKEALCVAATLARLGQAADLYGRIVDEEPVGMTIAGIACVDLMDGVGSRFIGADTPRRRIVDGLVDRLTFAAGFVASAHKYPYARPIIGALATREAAVSLGNTFHFLKTGETLKEDRAKWVSCLSLAAFGLAVNSKPERTAKLAGGASLGVNLLLAADYVRAWFDKDFGTLDDNGVRTIPGFSILKR